MANTFECCGKSMKAVGLGICNGWQCQTCGKIIKDTITETITIMPKLFTFKITFSNGETREVEAPNFFHIFNLAVGPMLDHMNIVKVEKLEKKGE